MYTVQIYCAVRPHMILTEDLVRCLKKQRLVAGGSKTLTFADREALFHYVRGFDYIDQCKHQRNRFLEATMRAPGDPCRHRFDSNRRGWLPYGGPTFAVSYYYLGYLTRDSEGRIVDLRNREKELYEFDNAAYWKGQGWRFFQRFREPRITRSEYKRLYEHRGHAFRFRYDPVPSLYSRNRGGPSQKSMHCFYEKRAYYATLAETEENNVPIQKLVRGKRGLAALPNPWDEHKHRSGQFNWKRQSKHKHQHKYDPAAIRQLTHYYDACIHEESCKEVIGNGDLLNTSSD